MGPFSFPFFLTRTRRGGYLCAVFICRSDTVLVSFKNKAGRTNKYLSSARSHQRHIQNQCPSPGTTLSRPFSHPLSKLHHLLSPDRIPQNCWSTQPNNLLAFTHQQVRLSERKLIACRRLPQIRRIWVSAWNCAWHAQCVWTAIDGAVTSDCSPCTTLPPSNPDVKPRASP